MIPHPYPLPRGGEVIIKQHFFEKNIFYICTLYMVLCLNTGATP